MTELKKWQQTIQISIANHLAYKSDVILQIIGPAIVFFLIKYQLWTSIYSFSEAEALKGYTLNSMIEYQAWVMLVGFLSQSYNSRNLAEDIRLGRITAYLVYPFEFWKFHTASFVAFQLAQLCIVAITTIVLTAIGLLPTLTLTSFCTGAVFSFLVGFLWFTIHYALGLLAFWLEETWMLRVTFIITAQFFSGAVIPLELFPDTLQSTLQWLPFPYMTFVPVKIFMNNYSGDIASAFVVLLIWIVLLSFAGKLIWQKGLRLYTAAGM